MCWCAVKKLLTLSLTHSLTHSNIDYAAALYLYNVLIVISLLIDWLIAWRPTRQYENKSTSDATVWASVNICRYYEPKHVSDAWRTDTGGLEIEQMQSFIKHSRHVRVHDFVDKMRLFHIQYKKKTLTEFKLRQDYASFRNVKLLHNIL